MEVTSLKVRVQSELEVLSPSQSTEGNRHLQKVFSSKVWGATEPSTSQYALVRNYGLEAKSFQGITQVAYAYRFSKSA